MQISPDSFAPLSLGVSLFLPFALLLLSRGASKDMLLSSSRPLSLPSSGLLVLSLLAGLTTHAHRPSGPQRRRILGRSCAPGAARRGCCPSRQHLRSTASSPPSLPSDSTHSSARAHTHTHIFFTRSLTSSCWETRAKAVILHPAVCSSSCSALPGIRCRDIAW